MYGFKSFLFLTDLVGPQLPIDKLAMEILTHQVLCFEFNVPHKARLDYNVIYHIVGDLDDVVSFNRPVFLVQFVDKPVARTSTIAWGTHPI